MSHAERYIGPRNKLAAARGARIRERVRNILAERARLCPLGRPMRAKEVRAILAAEGIRIALSTTAWHVARVRLESELEALEAEGGMAG